VGEVTILDARDEAEGAASGAIRLSADGMRVTPSR
jgi:hypothetical protein